jgi:hypothetical protein
MVSAVVDAPVAAHKEGEAIGFAFFLSSCTFAGAV